MRLAILRWAASAAALALPLGPGGPAHAETMVRADFAFPAGQETRIAVFRPQIQVGSRKLGGVDEPNADWTEAAREHIQAALLADAARRNARLVFVDDIEDEHAATLNTYRNLFDQVASAMMTHATGDDHLPTKTNTWYDREAARQIVVTRLDGWSLGEDAAQLRRITGADYALFVYSTDYYSDESRKTAQVAGALGCLVGVCVIVPSGSHIGVAGLVELETGSLVWFNDDRSIGGDPRQPAGAAERLRKLLVDFPALGAPSASTARQGD